MVNGIESSMFLYIKLNTMLFFSADTYILSNMFLGKNVLKRFFCRFYIVLLQNKHKLSRIDLCEQYFYYMVNFCLFEHLFFHIDNIVFYQCGHFFQAHQIKIYNQLK